MSKNLGGGYTCSNCGTYHRTSTKCNCKLNKDFNTKTKQEEIIVYVRGGVAYCDDPRVKIIVS